MAGGHSTTEPTMLAYYARLRVLADAAMSVVSWRWPALPPIKGAESGEGKGIVSQHLVYYAILSNS